MEAPEKLYGTFIDQDNWSISLEKVNAVNPVAYIRIDLIQERRRRVFEQYCFAVMADPRSSYVSNWNWGSIHRDVERILEESERFASKENKND